MSEGEQPLHSARMGLETNSNGKVYKQGEEHWDKKKLEIAMAIGSADNGTGLSQIGQEHKVLKSVSL